MGAGLADFGATNWVAMLVGLADVPSGYYLALCLDQPGPAMDGAILADLEPPPGTGYLRLLVPAGAGDWAVNGPYALNLNALDFGVATADWGLLNHFALVDSAAGGNLYGYGEFLNPQDVLGGQACLLPPGALVLTLTSLENSIAV